MPTGYTGMLKDGDVTFPEFAIRCARAFGPTILMRDDPMDAEIPDYFAPSLFYFKMLIRSQVELEVMRATTMEQAAILAQAARREQEETRDRREEDRLRLKGFYQDMLAEVMRWVPPTEDHQSMKTFMIEQITGSIDFDCSEVPALPDAPTPEEWRAGEIERLEREIERSEEHWQEEVDRCAGRAEWIRALRVSLRPAPEVGMPAETVAEPADDDEVIREPSPGDGPEE